MFNMRDPHEDYSRHYGNVRRRAEEKHGGIPSTWRVSQEIKRIAQRYGVGDLMTIESGRYKGTVTILSNRKIGSRLNDGKFHAFFSEIGEAIEDLGYKIAVGDDYWEVSPA